MSESATKWAVLGGLGLWLGWAFWPRRYVYSGTRTEEQVRAERVELARQRAMADYERIFGNR